jgi:hypothetical protein
MSGRVPPSSRAGKAARISRIIEDHGRDAVLAADLRERFTGQRTHVAGTVNIPPIPKVVALIGPVDFIGYTAVRDGRSEKYIHDFAHKDRPQLAVGPDGSIWVLGGGFEFTERGIVDDSDLKTRRELARDR